MYFSLKGPVNSFSEFFALKDIFQINSKHFNSGLLKIEKISFITVHTNSTISYYKGALGNKNLLCASNNNINVAISHAFKTFTFEPNKQCKTHPQ